MTAGSATDQPYVCLPVERPIDFSALHAAHPERYPHLLESVAQGSAHPAFDHAGTGSRFDILFAFPGSTLTLAPDLRLYRDAHALAPSNFLDAFDDLWRQSRRRGATASANRNQPPFTGGWFVFLSYELVREIEPSFADIPVDPTLPLAHAQRFPAAIIRDHDRQEVCLMCEAEQQDRLVPLMQADVCSEFAIDEESVKIRTLDEDDPAQYLAQIRRVQKYITAGDVFQVNLSRAWRIELEGAPAPVHLYRHLRAANPAPFSALMTLARQRAIISSSPERLVEVRGHHIRTRPIAGTYPRAVEADEDRRLARDLLAHPKERAEHVMLIDLERNDLGRVCRPGSVAVSDFMVLESYRHVHHIVSEVRGTLKEGIGPAQVIRATFPGGTITGCPKVRCMEIIAELEQGPRGAYTGSIGYINRDGSLDLNILIRTLVQDERTIRLRAGAGIVADSIPERELEETRAKARGLLRALGAT